MATNGIMRCPNCGDVRDGRFCANCGQNDRTFRRSLLPTVGELLRETFEIDSRVARTLQLLVLRPGQLSLEFSLDRRADYVSPIRLYLFASLTFFFVLSLTSDVSVVDFRSDPSDAATAMELSAGEDIDLEPLRGQLSAAEVDRLGEILRRDDQNWARLAALGTARQAAQSGPPSWASRTVYGQIVDVLFAPRVAVDRLIDNLPIAMFVLLPVYALLLMLFFRGRDRYYIEHLVFAVHAHSFAFIVFTLYALVPDSLLQSIGLGEGVGDRTLVVIVAVYYLLALHRYYGDGWTKTAVKAVLLGVANFVLLVPAFLGVMAVTFALL